MLSDLDESLLHQAPVSFDQTCVSDHRFFDRVWFGGFGVQGVRFMTGLATYKNTNTVDGYFVMCRDRMQHNMRLSRPMRPDVTDMAVGPLRIDVQEPLQSLKIAVAPSARHPFAAELLFTATAPVHEEAPHFKRADGRIVQDYTRFNQVGRFNGWVSLAGERVEVRDWFGARDHSWGVRPGVGGHEPVTSAAGMTGNPDDVLPADRGFLLISLIFDSPEYCGYFQLHEAGDGEVLYADGTCFRRTTHEMTPLQVKRITHELTFADGTRTWLRGSLQVVLADGTALRIEGTNLLPAWCFKGTGYDFGYADELGLGVFRGDLLESDRYDLSHPEDVPLPDGRCIRPWHREADAALEVNGQPGFAHFVVISGGPVARYNLTGATTNK